MRRQPWHDPVPPRARAWVAAVAGHGWRVRRVRALTGGVATAVDAVTLERGADRRVVVLRRWLRPGWAQEDQAPTPAHDAAILEVVGRSSLPVPRVLAVDAEGGAAGAPAIVTTFLEGRRPSLADERRPGRVDALARALAAVHALDDPRLPVVSPPFAPYEPLSATRTPVHTSRPGLWAEALAVAADPPPPGGPDRFLHRDFHPANTLWTRGRLTGVLDWAGASWGPAAPDLAHLRANLGSRHGIEVADAATAAYARAAGDVPPGQAWWDVRMLLDFMDHWPTVRGDELLRHEAYLGALLRRVG